MKKLLFFSAVLLFGFMACSESYIPTPDDETETPVPCETARRLAVGATERFFVPPPSLVSPPIVVTWKSNNVNVATVAKDGTVTAISAGFATITATTKEGVQALSKTIRVEGAINVSASLEGVIIDNIRWSTRNVNTPGSFAQNPTDAGMFYQWNRRQDWPVTGVTVTGWPSNATGTSWYAENDPCPVGWRVPTIDELRSLQNSSRGWIIYNGVNGRIFGDAPNQIFLPAVGNRNLGGWLSGGGQGHYWSSTLSTAMLDDREVLGAWYLIFSGGGNSIVNGLRTWGFSIRCVAK